MHSPPENEKVVKRGRKQKQGSKRNTPLQSQNCSEFNQARPLPLLLAPHPKKLGRENIVELTASPHHPSNSEPAYQ